MQDPLACPPRRAPVRLLQQRPNVFHARQQEGQGAGDGHSPPREKVPEGQGQESDEHNQEAQRHSAVRGRYGLVKQLQRGRKGREQGGRQGRELWVVAWAGLAAHTCTRRWAGAAAVRGDGGRRAGRWWAARAAAPPSLMERARLPCSRAQPSPAPSALPASSPAHPNPPLPTFSLCPSALPQAVSMSWRGEAAAAAVVCTSDAAAQLKDGRLSCRGGISMQTSLQGWRPLRRHPTCICMRSMSERPLARRSRLDSTCVAHVRAGLRRQVDYRSAWRMHHHAGCNTRDGPPAFRSPAPAELTWLTARAGTSRAQSHSSSPGCSTPVKWSRRYCDRRRRYAAFDGTSAQVQRTSGGTSSGLPCGTYARTCGAGGRVREGRQCRAAGAGAR